MARKVKVIYKKRKEKWSPNINEFSSEVTFGINGVTVFDTTICTNPAQNNTSVPQTFTVKNFEITFYCEGDATGVSEIDDLCAYVMFIPQGYQITNDINIQHPEWILNYKFIGSPYIEARTSQTFNYTIPHRVRSRLSRKLNTGDKVVLILKGTNKNFDERTVQFHGLMRWWTKAN